jgi:hypothetical protein
VSSVGVMEMPGDHVVNVVGVGHGVVAAADVVAVRCVVRPAGGSGSASDRVCGAGPDYVLVHVIAVDMMQVAIMQIVVVAIVRDRGVAAGGSMSVGVAVVSGVFRHGRGILLILRAPPAAART